MLLLTCNKISHLYQYIVIFTITIGTYKPILILLIKNSCC